MGGAEIIVGIPSYNNADTIGHVVRAAQEGLQKYFPARRALIVNSDGGSKDGTAQAIDQARLNTQMILSVSHPLYPMRAGAVSLRTGSRREVLGFQNRWKVGADGTNRGMGK